MSCLHKASFSKSFFHSRFHSRTSSAMQASSSNDKQGVLSGAPVVGLPKFLDMGVKEYIKGFLGFGHVEEVQIYGSVIFTIFGMNL